MRKGGRDKPERESQREKREETCAGEEADKRSGGATRRTGKWEPLIVREQESENNQQTGEIARAERARVTRVKKE